MRIQVAFIFHLNPLFYGLKQYGLYRIWGATSAGGGSWIAHFVQVAFGKYIKPGFKLANFFKSNCFLEIELYK